MNINIQNIGPLKVAMRLEYQDGGKGPWSIINEVARQALVATQHPGARVSIMWEFDPEWKRVFPAGSTHEHQLSFAGKPIYYDDPENITLAPASKAKVTLTALFTHIDDLEAKYARMKRLKEERDHEIATAKVQNAQLQEALASEVAQNKEMRTELSRRMWTIPAKVVAPFEWPLDVSYLLSGEPVLPDLLTAMYYEVSAMQPILITPKKGAHIDEYQLVQLIEPGQYGLSPRIVVRRNAFGLDMSTVMPENDVAYVIKDGAPVIISTPTPQVLRFGIKSCKWHSGGKPGDSGYTTKG